MQLKVEPLGLVQLPLASGTAVRIAVVSNGKPLSGAKVELYRYGLGGRPNTPILTLLCDKHGWVKTSKLSSGMYELAVHADNNLQANLLLQVSSRYGNRPVAFGMELRPSNPVPVRPDIAEADDIPAANRPQVDLTEAEKVPITDRLQVFRGVVTDPIGAVLPKAIIQLVAKEASGTKILDQIKSAADGEFEAQLSPGIYVAIFSVRGFKNKVIGFEISPEGTGLLKVTLEIGPPITSDWGPIPRIIFTEVSHGVAQIPQAR